MRLVTGIKGLVNSYFTQTRERLVIFGPGMERGFINFLMWDCNSMGISTTVETVKFRQIFLGKILIKYR